MKFRVNIWLPRMRRRLVELDSEEKILQSRTNQDAACIMCLYLMEMTERDVGFLKNFTVMHIRVIPPEIQDIPVHSTFVTLEVL